MPDASREFLFYSRARKVGQGYGKMSMRVLIADDVPSVQVGLRVLLEQQPGIEVVGEVVDALELLACAQTACPDLLLLGWELPGLVAANLLPALQSICPGLCVIVLSTRSEARSVALNAGADAFVSKTALPEGLLATILAILTVETAE